MVQGGACHDYFVHWPSKEENHPGGALSIQFQNGPIKEVGVNGCTHEVLLAIVIDRLKSFQAGPYACRENALALTKIQEAQMWLLSRTVSGWHGTSRERARSNPRGGRVPSNAAQNSNVRIGVYENHGLR